jgi:hypothetical protein
MYAPSGLRGMKQHAISESFEIRHLRHEMLQRRGLASQFPVTALPFADDSGVLTVTTGATFAFLWTIYAPLPDTQYLSS